MKKDNSVKVIYDGECPFCKSFVYLTNLKKLGYEVSLINAREKSDDIVRDIAKIYNLDDGMVVIIGNDILYGYNAARFLTTGFRATNLLAIMYYLVLRNEKFAELFYPILVKARKFYFRIVGKKLINDD